MRLTLEIETTSLEDVQEGMKLLNGLVNQLGVSSADIGKKVKAASEDHAKPAEQPVEEAEPADEKGEYTTEDIRAKVNELIKAGKRTEAKALLQEFGAAVVPQLKAEDYAAFMEKAEAL